MQMHCGPDAFGREACTEVKWAVSDERCPKNRKLKTVITLSTNTNTLSSSACTEILV